MLSIVKFIRKVIDGSLYAFIGPFTVLFIIPQFLVYLSNKYNLPYWGFPGGKIISEVVMWSGAALAVYCTLLMLFTGKGTPAVTSGPQKIMKKNIYAYLRHPMMWALTITLAGFVIYHGKLLLLVYFFAWLRIEHLYVVNYEEPQLEKRFGESWHEYCAEVPRWLPRLTKK